MSSLTRLNNHSKGAFHLSGLAELKFKELVLAGINGKRKSTRRECVPACVRACVRAYELRSLACFQWNYSQYGGYDLSAKISNDIPQSIT